MKALLFFFSLFHIVVVISGFKPCETRPFAWGRGCYLMTHAVCRAATPARGADRMEVETGNCQRKKIPNTALWDFEARSLPAWFCPLFPF